MTPQERFDALVEEFVTTPGVTPPGRPGDRGFGSDALKIHGSIFAMLTRGRLVVKLPRERVDTLVAQGAGEPFTAGKARPMREWLTVTSGEDATWQSLTYEALAFVAAGHP